MDKASFKLLEEQVFGALNAEISLTQGDRDQAVARVRLENLRMPMVKAFKEFEDTVLGEPDHG